MLLLAFSRALQASFLERAKEELEHIAKHDAALTAMVFPLRVIPSGQRELAAAIYRALSVGASARGIGKTFGSLFPLLKAWPTAQLDKIFFLTAKSPRRTHCAWS